MTPVTSPRIPPTRAHTREFHEQATQPSQSSITAGQKGTRKIRLEDLPALAIDHGRFMAKLADLQDGGETIPCVGDSRWVSDDRQAQAEAARACVGCPALAACGAYFRRWPEPVGVWAGLTERARDGRGKNGQKRVAS